MRCQQTIYSTTHKNVFLITRQKSPFVSRGRRDSEKGNMMTESLSDFNPEDYGAQQASDGWLWPVGDGNVILHWVTEPTGSDQFVIGRSDSIMNVSRLRGCGPSSAGPSGTAGPSGSARRSSGSRRSTAMSDARGWFDEASDDIIRLLHAPECEDKRAHKGIAHRARAGERRIRVQQPRHQGAPR